MTEAYRFWRPGGQFNSSFVRRRGVSPRVGFCGSSSFASAEMGARANRVSWQVAFSRLRIGCVRQLLELCGIPAARCRSRIGQFAEVFPGAGAGAYVRCPDLPLVPFRKSVYPQAHLRPCPVVAAWKSRPTDHHRLAKHLLPSEGLSVSTLLQRPRYLFDTYLPPHNIFPPHRRVFEVLF